MHELSKCQRVAKRGVWPTCTHNVIRTHVCISPAFIQVIRLFFFAFFFACASRKSVKAKVIGIIVIMRLSVGEQGGIGEQLTSCEESVKQGGGRERHQTESQNTLLSETPMQETSVKSVKDAPPLSRFSIYFKN